MQRVLVIGPSGSGKSTLAKQLGDATRLPVIHLDQHYWRPGWMVPDPDIWDNALAQLVERPRWIMDGNYNGSLPIRVAAADTVLFLDFPKWRCLCHILSRAISGNRHSGDDTAPGSPGGLNWKFLRHGRIGIFWRWRRDTRLRSAALNGWLGNVIVFDGPGAVARFLRERVRAQGARSFDS